MRQRELCNKGSRSRRVILRACHRSTLATARIACDRQRSQGLGSGADWKRGWGLWQEKNRLRLPDISQPARGRHRRPIPVPPRRPRGRTAGAGSRQHQGGAQQCALPSPWAGWPSKRWGSSGSGELPGLRPVAGRCEHPTELASVTDIGKAEGFRSVRCAHEPRWPNSRPPPLPPYRELQQAER